VTLSDGSEATASVLVPIEWGQAIYVQRYLDGLAYGDPFRINTHQISFNPPTIMAMPDGGYAVAYDGYDANFFGVYLQIFNAAGEIVAKEQIVNTTTADYQWKPELSLLGNGDIRVTRHSPSGLPFDGSFA
jgi:hypothetical protein